MTDLAPATPAIAQYDVDLLIVGGGINGVGIARDAAGRGLKVLLCEQHDLAGATSSASSKLIHGGLRYLEQYEFRLVREALAEREILLSNAPHIVRPLRFILPHNSSLRPAWMIRLGLFLYDHLARRSRLPGSRRLALREGADNPLKPELHTGFMYSDCRVHDARLVVLNAMDAAARGATIMPRWACTALSSGQDRWHAQLLAHDGRQAQVQARILVNAAGPWVEDVQRLIAGAGSPDGNRMRLVKGSHIVVPRLYPGEHAYILQNPDQRVVFVIPYEQNYSLIGTTDLAFAGDPSQVAISPEETDYLCAAVSQYFTVPVKARDVLWSYAGVRPLYDNMSGNPSAVTRDYVFDVRGGTDEQPVVLSIYGGKLTTYRRLAEHALEKLAPFIGKPAPWTAHAPLPGGDMPGGPEPFLDAFCLRHAWLPADVAQRYAHAYGTLADRVVGDAGSLADMGIHFGAGLYEREAAWLVDHEWAMTAEDILRRRTWLNLAAPEQTAAQLEQWLAARAA